MSTGVNPSAVSEQLPSLSASVLAAFTGEAPDSLLPDELISNARSILSVVSKAIKSGYKIDELEDVADSIRVAASLIETAQIFDHFENEGW